MIECKFIRGPGWAVVAALVLWAAPASAETYPSKPVRMVVPFAAGGGADLVARAVAGGLAKRLGQPIVVDNKPGGGGTLGADAVAKAPADGYTLLYTTPGPQITNPYLMAKLPYDPMADLTPVSQVAIVSAVLVVNSTIPATNVKELIQYARAHPGKLNFASAGVGSSSHLAGELFKHDAKIDIVHVPYRGTVAAMPDILTGRVAMMIDGVPVQTKNILGGTVRALAVTTDTRSPALPDVPTMKESGLDYVVPFWTAIYAPARTPKAVVEKLSAAIGKAMKSDDVTRRLADVGTEAVGSTAAELDTLTRQQFSLYREIVRSNPSLVEGQ